MSNSRMNAAADVMIARAKNTHYAVSTFAAVVYALIWALSNGAHAETDAQTETVLPAVVVTAYRSTLPELVVVGTREATASVAVLEAIVVTGKRDNADVRVAAASTGFGTPAVNGNVTHVGYVAKMRNWLRTTLAKVSG